MRTPIENPLSKLLRLAERAIRPPDEPTLSGGTVSAAGRPVASPSPPVLETTAGVDEAGQVYTIHPFLHDLDAHDDAGAVMI